MSKSTRGEAGSRASDASLSYHPSMSRTPAAEGSLGPPHVNIGVSLYDLGTGIYAVALVLAGLLEREKSG